MTIQVRKRTDGKIELKNTADEKSKPIVLTKEQGLTLAQALTVACK